MSQNSTVAHSARAKKDAVQSGHYWEDYLVYVVGPGLLCCHVVEVDIVDSGGREQVVCGH